MSLGKNMASEAEELKELAGLARKSGDQALELKALEKLDSLSVAKPAEKQEESGISGDIARQLGLTLRAGTEGVLSLPAMLAEIPRQALNLIPGIDLPEQQQAISDYLTSLGVPVPENEQERIIQAASQALAGAGGVAGAAKGVASGAEPVTKAVASQLAAQPGAQLAGAGASGLAGQSAAELGAGPVGQAVASLAGGVAGAGAAGRTATKPTGLKPAIQEAEQRGIKVLTSDIKPPRTFAAKWLQSTGEKIPLAGTGKAREIQQQQRISAIRNTLRDFGVDDASQASDEVMKDLAKKRSGQLNKYTKMKGEVFDRLDDAGEVPVTNTINAIDNQITKLEGLKTAEVRPIIERLSDFRDSVQGQGIKNVELLRKQLGESFKAPDLVSARSTGEKAVSNIYGAIRKDMGEFIKATGERRDISKWTVANGKLSEMAGEIKKGALKSVLARGDETPEVVKQMLFSKKPSEVRLLYKSLTPHGRTQARIALLQEVASKAGENISPEKFVSQLKRFGDNVGVLFSGKDLQQVRGLMRSLELTGRASQAAVSPPTGVQVAIPVGAAVLADIFGTAGAALGAGASMGFLARAYESPQVRNLLIKLPSVVKGSPEEAAIMKRLLAIRQTKEQQ